MSDDDPNVFIAEDQDDPDQTAQIQKTNWQVRMRARVASCRVGQCARAHGQHGMARALERWLVRMAHAACQRGGGLRTRRADIDNVNGRADM